MAKGKIDVVVGGQFGSEGKGAIAGYLAGSGINTNAIGSAQQVVAVRVGGPNAGHTVYGRCPAGCTQGHIKQAGDLDFTNSHAWRLRQIPVAAVTNESANLVIAAGSEVDLDVLDLEIDQLNSAGYHLEWRLYVDQSATLLLPSHQVEEQARGLTGRIGSTGKGIGAARASRLWREATLLGEVATSSRVRYTTTDTARLINRELRLGSRVVIEGTQGYGLGLHTEFYPKCTSGDARAIDFLAQAGVSPWAGYVENLTVWVVVRTKPIRVAGDSGPLKGETTWENLKLAPEKTTVTQKVRRVGEYDHQLVRDAVIANGGLHEDSPVKIALTMVDYEISGLRGATNTGLVSTADMDRLSGLVWGMSDSAGAPVRLVGTSPTTVLDMGSWT